MDSKVKINDSMKRAFFLLIISAGLMLQSFAQKQGKNKIDSLFTVLKTSGPDTAKVNTLNNLAYEFRNNNPDTAIYFASEAKALGIKLNYKMGVADSYLFIAIVLNNHGKLEEALKNNNIALGLFDQLLTSEKTTSKSKIPNQKVKSYNNIGIIYSRQGNYPEALKNYQAALKISEETGNKNGIANSYNNSGIIHHYQGNYPEALKNYFAALRTWEEIGDKYNIANSYNNIAIIYERQENYPEALKNLYASLKIREELGDKKSIAASHNNIGTVYINQGNNPEALKNLSIGLKIAEEIGDKHLTAFSLNNIANILSDQGNYSEALKNYFASLRIFEEMHDEQNIAHSYYIIGRIYIKQNKNIEASHYLNKALLLAKDIGSSEDIENCYFNLVTLDSTQGNFKKALEHYKLFITTRDSMFNKENTKKITQQQMQFEFDKKQVADSLKFEKEKETGALKLQKQKAFTYTGFAGVALTLLFLFFIYRGFRKQKRSNHIIEQTNQELHKVNNELKETQAQLVQQEKLASLGALTAGIAHEIKNPLNFVNNFAELNNELIDELENSRDEEEKKVLFQTIKQNLSKINEHGKRADGIVKSMLEHSRSGTGEKQPTDINRLCDEYLNLAYHGMRANVKDFNCSMERHFAENLPKINIVQQDISRVLLNLINNAFYAIKDKPGATLTLTTLATAHSVIIKIKDNGTGIPESVKQRIFEPFFTTKPTGTGTGLGLSLSFDIVKAHGGKIEVVSEEGKGTKFIITLPV